MEEIVCRSIGICAKIRFSYVPINPIRWIIRTKEVHDHSCVNVNCRVFSEMYVVWAVLICDCLEYLLLLFELLLYIDSPFQIILCILC